MKNKIINFLKTGILLVGISLSLWNCQQQDDLTPVEIVQEKKIKTISFNDLKNETAYTKSFTSITRYFDKYQAPNKSSVLSKTSENEVILTDKIIKIEKEESTSYTFRLLKTGEGNEFYNLVIDVDHNGNIQKSVIVEYIPSGSWLADTSRPFSGYVSVQNNTIFSADDIADAQSLSKTDSCYEVSYEWECNAGNDHAPNTCTAGGSDLVITYFEVPCPYEGGGTGGVAYPVGEGAEAGPGGGGSEGGSDPGADSGMSSPIGPDDSTPVENAFFDDQVFIDDSFKEHPCLKAVYDAMGKATKFSEYLYNFESDFSVADLRFSANDNFSEAYEDYPNAMAITDPPLASNLINITFNTDSTLNGNILTKPDVYKAVAMIHEILHAEMYRKMLDAVKTAEINQTNLNWRDWPNDTDFGDFIEALENKYFGIFDYYTRYDWNTSTPNNAQHQAMAQHYRDIIKQALTDYDPALTEAQKDALSWLGLKDATVVAWQNLSDEEKNIINDTLAQIKNTFPNGCN